MKKTFKRVLQGGSVVTLSAVTAVHAAVPASVNTALTDAATDTALVGGLAFAALVAAVVFKYWRRAL